MMKGKVLEVSELKSFEMGGSSYDFRNILFDLGDNKLLYTTLWGSKRPPEIGQMVKFIIEVSSERNKKDPSLFFHKVKLVYYENYDQPLLQKNRMDEPVWNTWEEDGRW